MARNMAMPQIMRLFAGFPPERSVVARSSHAGFVGRFSPDYIGFPFQFSFHQKLYIYLSYRTGKIDQLVADVQCEHSLTPIRQN
jgi:hypothetical protein